MPFSVEGLTVEDFNHSDWREVVAGVKIHDCVDYRAAFDAKVVEAKAKGDEKATNLFALLGDLASMFIDSDDSADPLKPMWQSGGQRSAIPGDFDPALGYLADMLPHVDDPELRARIADVLWLRKHDFRAAREGSSAYLAAARLDASEQRSDPMDRIERAIDLAARANQADLLDAAIQTIEAGLASFDGAETTFLPADLMTLLQARKVGDPVRYAPLAQAFALSAESRGDWDTARAYWNIQAEWHRLAKGDEQARAARLRSAETFVKEAEARLANGESQGQMVATHFLERAIQTLRTIGDQQERIGELHSHLLDHQRQAASEMGTISVEADPTELVARATAHVAGKSLYDAVFALALLGRPPSVETLRKQAEWQRYNSVLSLIPMRYKNAMGRTVARRDPPEVGESQDEADVRIEMYQVANLGRSLHAQALIEPARAQILREHTVRVADMMAIVCDNSFVPPGREDFFAHGLQAGFKGDFAAAVHLLVPQIENSVRYVLEQRDVITSGLDDEGIQDERDLNRTLRLPEFAEPLKEDLGEDLVFDLRGLLIERYGANLRNDTAHGLLDYGDFYSPPCVYLWWLTLRLCCTPVITALSHHAAEDASASTGVSDTRADPEGEHGGGEETT